MDGAGAVQVLQQQRAWLVANGYTIGLILIAPHLSWSCRKRRLRRRNLREAALALGFEDITIIGIGWRKLRRWSAIAKLLASVFGKNWSIDMDLMISDSIAADALPLTVRHHYGGVICNYLSGLSAADAIAPPPRQLLVLHDWISTDIPARIAGLLRDGRQRLALNEEEAERITALAPDQPCLVGLPVGLTQADQMPGPLRHVNLSTVLAASGPRLPQEPGRPSPAPDALAQGTHSSIELLFIGGAHPPNCEGISAFVRSCFGPFLSPRGVQLVVAGAAGPAAGLPPMPGLHVLGPVRDLRPLYAAAQLVVVPLLSGTGVSIKTLEAISFGKPVLTTPIGVRGLGGNVGPALPPPFDRRWADQILVLLSDPTLRERWSLDQRNAVSQQTLEKALTRAFDRIRTLEQSD
ncbi:glycosyltransferase family 4 protein [Bosea sp. 2RAB26]|uniref:glycosyltransferase family 4 protein n=1 Tax=Bosea sp. 2RAB26 TaxID=3237476 RepID=UPI003F8FB37E